MNYLSALQPYKGLSNYEEILTSILRTHQKDAVCIVEHVN